MPRPQSRVRTPPPNLAFLAAFFRSPRCIDAVPSTTIEGAHLFLQAVPLPFAPRGHISQRLAPGSRNRQVGNASSPGMPSIAPFHVC